MARVAEALIAGFDAGQSHTCCRLALLQPNGQHHVLAEGDGPGVCHLAASGGPQRFQAALRGSLEAARSHLREGRFRLTLHAAAIGASGIEAGSPIQREGQQLAAATLDLATARVEVTGDERTALRGAFPQGPGIIVISGTGCICLGRSLDGREVRAGGWGWLLDGAGSALDIGRDGLALSLQMADGRRPEGALRPRLWQALGLDPSDPGSPQQLKALVVSPEFGPAGLARLAPLVHELAVAGDAAADAILEHSATALAEMVAAVARNLTLHQPPVAGLGGALLHLSELRRHLQAALERHCPGARLITPAGDGAAGALALAAELSRR